jgi:acetyltransferase
VTEYPGQLARTHRLFDGRTVTVRPIRPDDSDAERRFLEELSGTSWYQRFQKWVSAPNEKLVHFLTHIDYERHLAFVCAAAGGESEVIVGEARYVVNPDNASCEFGIMIADGWHHTGIAGLLMETIIGIARSRGLKLMEGQVLTSNTTMLRFARGLGFEVEAVPGDLTIRRVVKKL